MRTVTVVAHRGDPHRVRENTLPSLRSALDRGADVVEIDVRLTADGVPVLLHDASLKRLWEYERPLALLSAAEVSGVTRGGVPTLEEALKETEGHRVLVDLPDATPRTARTVVGTVAACGAGDRVAYCAGPAEMLAVRDADPAAEIALTWTTLAPPRPALLAAIRPRWLNYRFGLVTPPLVDRVHAQGYLISAWTADTRRTMRKLVSHGVDSITTNRVDALAAVLRRRRETGREPQA
ncbi:glycerophosphoryl diester phosphodiesterase [Streptomyces longispororuber]|uniref:Glycerophosphoryl diester phosphodiesterase n=1 Tax=Streptomyces longispororuber TaxID=68230 RepID=A0A919DP21_9ACTN|nr:glycerophosphodiester phosphodiesterase [Streptomyces longispororuber]GHE67867.1 glycerophosphoryl diester phosphodiesterase [Streptomyces longispororuber]